MKRISKLLSLLAVAWILAVAVWQLGPLIGASIRPMPESLRHRSWLLQPSDPFVRFTWTTLWPMAVGVALILIAAAFSGWVKRGKKRLEGSEA